MAVTRGAQTVNQRDSGIKSITRAHRYRDRLALLITSAADDLPNAAFGDDPGRWPLPAAQSAEELWLRAVVAGGQGRYASAYADLACLRRAHRVGRLASLAHSTQASFLRQLGWHDEGPRLGRPGAGGGGQRSPRARADALIGLAADALGVGRFAASAEALRRARGFARRRPAAAGRPAGVGVGRIGDGDRRRRGRDRSRRAGGRAGRRPRLGCATAVKSEVVLAAALCSDGQARPVARGGRRRAGHHAATGNRPAELGVGVPARRKSAAGTTPLIKSLKFATMSADTVRRRGGVLQDR